MARTREQIIVKHVSDWVYQKFNSYKDLPDNELQAISDSMMLQLLVMLELGCVESIYSGNLKDLISNCFTLLRKICEGLSLSDSCTHKEIAKSFDQLFCLSRQGSRILLNICEPITMETAKHLADTSLTVSAKKSRDFHKLNCSADCKIAEKRSGKVPSVIFNTQQSMKSFIHLRQRCESSRSVYVTLTQSLLLFIFHVTPFLVKSVRVPRITSSFDNHLENLARLNLNSLDNYQLTKMWWEKQLFDDGTVCTMKTKTG